MRTGTIRRSHDICETNRKALTGLKRNGVMKTRGIFLSLGATDPQTLNSGLSEAWGRQHHDVEMVWWILDQSEDVTLSSAEEEMFQQEESKHTRPILDLDPD